MTGVEYVLGGLVVIAVLAFVGLPLFQRHRAAPAPVSVVDHADERAAIYRELLELELDQKVGKIAEVDYREMSDALLARAAALISDEDAQISAANDAVEREIAALRKATGSPESVSSGEPRT